MAPEVPTPLGPFACPKKMMKEKKMTNENTVEYGTEFAGQVGDLFTQHPDLQDEILTVFSKFRGDIMNAKNLVDMDAAEMELLDTLKGLMERAKNA